jgi:hypothetical protein
MSQPYRPPRPVTWIALLFFFTLTKHSSVISHKPAAIEILCHNSKSCFRVHNDEPSCVNIFTPQIPERPLNGLTTRNK